MKKVTLQIANPDEVKQRARAALAGHEQGARIGFASAELLFRLLTNKRWEVVRRGLRLPRFRRQRPERHRIA
jgi:hypothetical protein